MDAGYEDVVMLEEIVELVMGVEDAVGIKLEEVALDGYVLDISWILICPNRWTPCTEVVLISKVSS